MKYELVDVCNKMLDNANLFLDLSAFPKIQFRFIVYGSVDEKFWEVKFYCGQTIDLKIESDNDITTNDIHTVLEVSVFGKEPKTIEDELQHRIWKIEETEVVWFISIYGSSLTELKLICCQFNWELRELISNEYAATFI